MISSPPLRIPKKPELLAPAGSLEAFFAALEKGADAVYAGLSAFSARAGAKNFTLPQMERVVGYAHAHGRKVYVTLNTLVKERELAPLAETLSALEAMAVDGVILQDLGVWRLIRDHFPGIPLHASTQMTVHNTPGVRQLEGMGFSRVVLARELHLDEIRAIHRQTAVELEVFIHGALCFSISGQCFFSSFLGGHSGNRGRCAQPCRRHYRHGQKEGYYLSTNDLSTIDLVPELAAAGVASFKIEGRMKSAEYVATVVEAYRKVIDAPERSRPAAVAAAKELLKLSYGRVPTKGFLASPAPTDISTPSLRGATGRFLGEIRAIKGGRIAFESRDPLYVGDRLRVQPKTDMAGKGFTVRELFVAGKPVKAVREKSRLEVAFPFAAQVGDAVFKVASGTAFTLSENACRRRLESAPPAKIPCRLTAALADGELTIAAEVAGTTFRRSYPLGPLDPARTEDMAGVLRGQFERTGDTPFSLAELAAPGFPRVLIPPTRLKELRRQFYADLAGLLLPDLARSRAERLRRAQAALAVLPAAPSHRRAELAVRIESLRDWTLLRQEGVDTLSVPVSRANLHQLPLLVGKLRHFRERIAWHLPFMVNEADLPWYREALAELQAAGFRHFEAANLGHLPLLAGADRQIITDYRLFSLNSQAIQAWRELGVTACTLYIEDDAENLADLLAADLPLPRRVVILAGVPVITTKIKIKEIRSDAPLVSDRSERYRVTARDGLTTVTAETPFSLTGFRRRLEGMGCASFLVDLSGIPRDSWSRVLEAFARGTELPGTSPFNFEMGLV